MQLQFFLIFKFLLIATFQRTGWTQSIALAESEMPIATLILERFATVTAIEGNFIELALQISVQIFIWSLFK